MMEISTREIPITSCIGLQDLELSKYHHLYTIFMSRIISSRNRKK